MARTLRVQFLSDTPVVQAGMGGGVAGGALAGAVSAAGGLGTVGIMAPRLFAEALAEARSSAGGRPVAANLLAPFTRRAHVDICIAAGVAMVVVHGGSWPGWADRLKSHGIPVFVTVGTADEARAAVISGADGLVVQGLEAGGHLVGVEPLEQALTKVLTVAGADVPVLAAGGVATGADVRRLLDLGAAAAVAGTRFLLTEESSAHPIYKHRVLEADRTIVTLLFGLGWPLRHRVVPNLATERWCSTDELSPRWVQRVGRMTAPLGRALPMAALSATSGLQRPGLPLFSPGLPLAGMPGASVDHSALYAGETLHRIDGVLPAAEAVAELTP